MSDDTHCPNCGALKRGIVCEYCGTRFHESAYTQIHLDNDVTVVKDWSGDIVHAFINAPRKYWIQ